MSRIGIALQNAAARGLRFMVVGRRSARTNSEYVISRHLNERAAVFALAKLEKSRNDKYRIIEIKRGL